MKEKSGMRGTPMPKEHFEKKQPSNEVCKEKYASEFGNPEDLTKAGNALASYAKKNKMKY